MAVREVACKRAGAEAAARRLTANVLLADAIRWDRVVVRLDIRVVPAGWEATV